MTPGVILFYLIFEVDLNNKKYGAGLEEEELMPYAMADLYVATRTEVAKLYRAHFTYVFMAFFTGAVIFSVYFACMSEGGVVLGNGWTMDLFSYGAIVVLTFVI